ncbi:MAG: hypothetical protein O3A46_14230, partial [Candidatus Poribacteria bacterium]|nr:hypothetical protein [Candidatus Poribacteria bacterium]
MARSRVMMWLMVWSFTTLIAANADILQWEATPGPLGGYVQELVGREDGVVFASVKGHMSRSAQGSHSFLYRLNLNTEVWDALPFPTDVIITALTVVGDSVYVGTWKHGAFRSDDAGDRWTRVPSAGFPAHSDGFLTIRGIAVVDDDLFIAANRTSNFDRDLLPGVYRFDQQTQTWMNTALVPSNVEWMTATQGVLLIGIHFDSVFRSDDKGQTWERIPGAGGIQTTTLAQGTDHRVVVTSWQGFQFESTGGGRSWSQLSRDFPRGWQANRDNQVAVVSQSSPFVSASFVERMNGDLLITNASDSMTSAPTSVTYADGHVYVGTRFGGVLRWEGDRWVPFNAGLRNAQTLSMTSFNGTIYATTRHAGLWRTSDLGETWEPVGLFGAGLQTVHADENGILVGINRYTPSSSGGGFNSLGGMPEEGILYSRDDGATWNAATLPGHIEVHAIVRAGDVYYAGHDSTGVLASFDNGETWDYSPRGVRDWIPYMTVFDGVPYAVARGVWYLPPGAAEWVSAEFIGQARSVTSSNTVYVGSTFGVHRLEPDGSWITLGLNGWIWSVVAFEDELFAGAGGVYQYRDGGWDAVGLSPFLVTVLHREGDYLFAGTNTSGIFRARLGSYILPVDPKEKGVETWARLKDDALKGVETALAPAFPNPSNPEVWIPFTLEKSSEVVVTVYNL